MCSINGMTFRAPPCIWEETETKRHKRVVRNVRLGMKAAKEWRWKERSCRSRMEGTIEWNKKSLDFGTGTSLHYSKRNMLQDKRNIVMWLSEPNVWSAAISQISSYVNTQASLVRRIITRYQVITLWLLHVYRFPLKDLCLFFSSILITGLLQLLFLNFQYLGGLNCIGMHLPFTFVVWHAIQSGFRRTCQTGDPYLVFLTRSSFVLC